MTRENRNEAIIPEVVSEEAKGPGTALDVIEPLSFEEWNKAQQDARENTQLFLTSMEAKIGGALMRESMEKLMRVLHYRQVKEILAPMGKWAEWCQLQGIRPHVADYQIQKLGKWKDDMLIKFLTYSKLPFNKIQYLANTDREGRLEKFQLTHDGEHVFIDGEPIPLDKDEIQAAIQIVEEQKQEALKKIEETKADGEKTNKALKKAERELARIRREAKKKEISPEEAAFLEVMDEIKSDFDGIVQRIDNAGFDVGEERTPRMAAEARALFDYMEGRIAALWVKG